MDNGRSIRGIAAAMLVLALLLSAAPPAAAGTGGTDAPAAAPDGGGEAAIPLPDGGSSGRTPEAASSRVDVPDVSSTITGTSPGERLGEQLAGVGDVNNDGFDDFVVLSINTGVAYVYMGGTPFKRAPVTLLLGTNLPLTEQSQVRPAGDLDNDGFADVIVSAPAFYLPGKRAVGAVYVFYGTPDGLKAVPDQIIYGRDADGRFGIGIDSVGDINRDGYSDLVLGADGVNADTGRVLIYLGGPRGLEEAPAWLWDGEAKGDRFGHAVTGAGDLNGDGWPDFAVGAPFAVSGDSRGRVYIFYGASSLSDIRVGKTLQGQMLRSYFGLAIRLAGDVNNDGFSDLLIASPDTSSGSFPGAGQVSLYLGSEYGIKDSPARIIEGESNESHLGFSIAYLGDVNRDGCDDVAIGAQMFSTPDMTERGKFYVFFGDRLSGFSAEAKAEEVGSTAGQHLSAGLAGAGDIDGDGFADLLVGAPGYDVPGKGDAGAVLIYRGADITFPPLLGSAVRFEDREQGGLLLPEYRAYHLVAAFTHRSGLGQLGTVELHLDPRGEDVIYTYIAKTDSLVETRDPKGLARAGTVVLVDDPAYRDTYDLWVDITLNWGFPADRPLSVRVAVSDLKGLRVGGDYGGLGRVVGSLAFAGGLTMMGDRQGPLEDGAWVRGSEGIDLTGFVVGYDLIGAGVPAGTAFYPPQGTFAVVARDDVGGEWEVAPGQGEPVSVRVVAPAVSRTDLVYTVSLETPDHTTVFRTLAAHLRVDATPVRFDSPEPSATVASLRDTASVVITDPFGPGVDRASVQYCINLAGGDDYFGHWQDASVRDVGEGVVVAEAYELFTEGRNYIMWRARDLVGNGPAVSTAFPVVVDLGNITFASPAPADTLWFNTPIVTAGITIEDSRGNAIDLLHIQYRTSTSPGAFSDWLTVPEPSSGTASRATVTVDMVRLAEGRSNYIQWRARDLQRREFITSPLYRIQVDLSGPVFSDPAPPQERFVGERQVIAVSVLVRDGLSGVAEGSIRYRVVGELVWRVPTVVREGPGFECTAMVNLPEGPDNYIAWQAVDLAGNVSTPFSQRIMVDRTPPTLTEFSPPADSVARQATVEVSVRVDDRDAKGGRGSGVDLATFEYTVSRPSTGGYSAWVRPDGLAARGVVPFYMVTFTITVDGGDENLIVVRVWDGTGNNTVTSEPYRITARLPVPPLELPPVIQGIDPKGPSVRYGQATYFDVTAYSPQGRDLAYQWYSSIDGPLSAMPGFSALLSKGHHTITLTVKEVDGGRLSTQRVFELDVEPPAGPHPPLSGLAERVAIVLIVAFVIVAAVLQRYRIREW